MKAYVTSIGEKTTELCIWSLERNGFDVEVYKDNVSLAHKLQSIFQNTNDDFLRVDADIIINRYLTPKTLEAIKQINEEIWWWQFIVFDWYKQDIAHSLSFIRKEALPDLRQNADRFLNDLRPETELSRIKEFYEPRRFETFDGRICGIHGYGIDNLKPVIRLKANRGQSHLYDFELATRLNEL